VASFLYGAAAMGCAVTALFFHRFWRQSTDRLFLLFSIAFWILGSNYAVLGLVRFADETRVYVFLVRLVAFSIILYAIVDKNRR
jgi:hypothetical protein